MPAWLVVPAAAAALGALALHLRLRRKLAGLRRDLMRAQRSATAGRVTAGLAHELKNSLTVVAGFADLARGAAERAPGTDAKVLRHLRELDAEARRTAAFLQQFVAQADAPPAARAPHDVRDLLREALRLVGPMARLKELQLASEWGEAPRVSCDAAAIREVLLNLLLNALEFARGRISVAAGPGPGGGCEVRVEDDGPGVPAELRDRLFERSAGARPGGNGLGLWLGREVAEAHGGTLTLRPGPGPGACFVLRLPSA